MDATETTGDDLMPIPEILDRLGSESNQLPVEAIQAARQQKERVIPELIRVLQDSVEAVKKGEEPQGPEFLALFLLAEFRAAEALPAILAAISLPGEGPFEMFGDAVHDVLPRVLVSLAGGRCLEICTDLLRNLAINEYVRWSAVKAIVYLGIKELRPRSEIVDVCRGLLRGFIVNKDVDGVTAVTCEMLNLAPVEAIDDIKAAYDGDLVDESIIGDWESVEEKLKSGAPMVGREYDESPSVDDTIDELKDWASFREDELENGNELEYENDMEPDEWSRPRPSPPPVTPPLVLYPDKSDRVGRNDPCPCGSGKKHKRCCMRSR
jgi:hypothetical protein